MPPRSVIVAGAGIGGLTAALALVRSGFRVTLLEQAERLEETGAGIQLSPNATRTLIDLGLGDRLRPHVVAPQACACSADEADAKSSAFRSAKRRRSATARRTGSSIAAICRRRSPPRRAGARYLAPARHAHGRFRHASARRHRVGAAAAGLWNEHGHALIAADGLWSASRARLGFKEAPRFAGRTAWRALVPAKEVAPEFREPLIHLWLGRDAHLVHYPVKAGKLINVVVITDG